MSSARGGELARPAGDEGGPQHDGARGPGVAVDALEQQLGRAPAERVRVLGDHGQAGADDVREQDVRWMDPSHHGESAHATYFGRSPADSVLPADAPRLAYDQKILGDAAAMQVAVNVVK